MMRWLFIGLVIINAFYFLWSQQWASPSDQPSAAQAQKVASTAGQVQLLSEVVATDEQQAKNKDTFPARAGELLLGGFADEQLAFKLQQRLLSLDIKSEIEAVDEQVSVEYWVYLQPLPSTQASMRQLKELQARNIEGYLITQGDLANGVSLGFFAHEDTAQNVVQRLSSAGYEPVIRQIAREQRLYWVLIEAHGRRLVDEKLLEQLAADFEGIQHLLRPYSQKDS